ncbi:hypothetical protein QJ48_05660 [Paenibacillus sp. A3]|nr:hypothetical protein QJ48_05660 [Paenibacillus sp. A3]
MRVVHDLVEVDYGVRMYISVQSFEQLLCLDLRGRRNNSRSKKEGRLMKLMVKILLIAVFVLIVVGLVHFFWSPSLELKA